MESSAAERLESLFDKAVSLPPDMRGAFLDEACTDDPKARSELESLLAAAEAADAFFDHFAVAVQSRPPWLEPTADERGTTDPLIGRSIRQYEIEELLGRGGMGVVYRARDTRLGRTVALKFLPPYLSADEAATERFLVEARAAAALDHPNVCTVYEVGEDDEGRLFIAMAFYEGETLKQKIDRGPLPIDEGRDYARQIAAGLEAAHGQEIIHRDIKPGNVIVTPDGLAKILDFGLAKLTDVTLTGSRATMGTVAYMSPEQASSAPVDHRTDLWSLGVVLYEMLTGERPFRGDRTAIVIHSILNEEPIPPSALRPELPPALDSVVARLLTKDRDRRPASVEEAGLDVSEVTLPKGVLARPSGPGARLRSWRAVAALVGSIAAVAVLWFARGPSTGVPASGLSEARVAVFPFENRSGDPMLDYVGEYAAFGIMDGLSWMDETAVVDWSTVRQALRAGEEGTGVQEIASRFGAGTSVTGAFMRLGDRLQFHAQITGVERREVIHAVDAAGSSAELPAVVETLTQRVMGALATTLGDARTTRYISRPPSYEAFQAWARGIERWWARDWQGALDHYREAYQLDTTFVNALFGIQNTYGQLGLQSKQDSVVTLLESRRSELSPIQQYWVDARRAAIAGDRLGELEAMRPTLRFDPEQWTNLVLVAVRAGRPEEALQIWENFQEGRLPAPSIAPDLNWPAFWMWLGAAQHTTGRYSEQLATARQGLEVRDDLGVRFHEIQALVALGRMDEVTRLLDEVERMEPLRGWSPGWVFHYVAADLARHGHAAEGQEVAHQAVSWFRSRDPQAYAGEMAEALLLAGQPGEAVQLVRLVVAENPDDMDAHGLLGMALARFGDRTGAEAEARWLEELDLPYLRGANTYLRAAIAAHLGQSEIAVRLLRRALQEGIVFNTLHFDPRLAPLWGYEPFEQAIAPRG
jgi:tetratricopeptide (TPR) repeat protein/TolB-like protein